MRHPENVKLVLNLGPAKCEREAEAVLAAGRNPRLLESCDHWMALFALRRSEAKVRSHGKTAPSPEKIVKVTSLDSPPPPTPPPAFIHWTRSCSFRLGKYSFISRGFYFLVLIAIGHLKRRKNRNNNTKAYSKSDDQRLEGGVSYNSIAAVATL